ncbi:MAG: lysophospholipid acyltransferase family protein [Halothiobacillus sp.]
MPIAFLRSVIFQIASYIALIVYVPVMLIGWLIPAKRRYYVMFSYGFTVMWLARLIVGLRWQVEGLHNLPKPSAGQGRLIAAKHQSTWDSMILPTLLNQPAFILKKELLWIPIFGTGLAGMGPIAIDRKAGSKALKIIIKEGKAQLAAGRDVIIFPEGTRYRPDANPEYKIGAAMLAIQAHTEVTPIAINSGCHWPKGQFIKSAGTIHVVIGPPIAVTGKRADRLTEEIEHWIETEQHKLYAQYGCKSAPKLNAKANPNLS